MKIKLLLALLIPSALYAAFGTLTIYQNAGTSGSALYVQSHSCSAAGTFANCASTMTVTQGSVLVVDCVMGGASDTFNVSDDKSNSYTAILSPSIVSNAGGIVNGFYAKNVPAGVTTVTCRDTSLTASWVQVIIHEYSGLDPGLPFDIASSSAPLDITPSTTTIVTGNITTTANNELVHAFAARINSTVLNQNGTLRENYVDNVYMTSQDKVVASAGTVYQSSWTIASGQVSFAAYQASFKLPKGRGTIVSQ